MKKQDIYYKIFLSLSSFSRGLVDAFSLVMLYQKGYSVREIFIFIFITYLVGIFASYVSICFYKRVMLVISNIVYGICFMYLSCISYSFMHLIFLGILFSFSHYSYHTIRHYYAFKMLKDRNNTGGIVSMMYLSSSVSALIGGYLLQYCSFSLVSIILFVMLFISCFFIYYCYDDYVCWKLDIKMVHIDKRKILFSVLEQFKVLFMEIQPLFIYLYISDNYSYIGIVRVIMNIASLLVIYYLGKNISLKRFFLVTIFLGIILSFKIWIRQDIIMFFLVFLEGIFVKLYEIVSLKNLYDYGDNNINGYLFVEEVIFLISKCFVILFCIIFHINFIILLYMFIMFIIFSGFFV